MGLVKAELIFKVHPKSLLFVFTNVTRLRIFSLHCLYS